MADLIIDNLTKQYPTRRAPLTVLEQISCELSRGENLAILGPSGSGKSTFLHVIGTLDPPTAGRITLSGEDPYELPEPQLARFRNRHIGFVFQDHHLLPQLSVLENVLVPTLAEGRPSQAAQDRARELVQRVGLEPRLDHRPAELSGGERGRVAVARALVCEPQLLLADEPTGNLDRHNAQAIGELLVELQSAENTMLIVVTHSPQLAEMMQRQVQLENGRFVDYE